MTPNADYEGRVVSWYSHGAASAVATKMTIAKYGSSVVVACIDTRSEHSDNERFHADCQEWFDHQIVVLGSERYHDIYDVFDRTGYLVGPGGARCTTELKRRSDGPFRHLTTCRYSATQPTSEMPAALAASQSRTQRSMHGSR